MSAHSDYLDPSRYEQTIGPIEETFRAMLDSFQVDVATLSFYYHCGSMEARGIDENMRLMQSVPKDHDALVQFVAELEMKLAAANGQLEALAAEVKPGSEVTK